MPPTRFRWLFKDRENDSGGPGTFRDTTVALSAFGTADQRLLLPAAAALGRYQVVAQLKRAGRWVDVASASYRIAEYRPPEFLVNVAADSGVRYADDSLAGTVDARYLFGAPMGRAAVRWTLRQQPIGRGASIFPGSRDSPSEERRLGRGIVRGRAAGAIATSGADTLDAAGRLRLHLRLGEATRAAPRARRSRRP